MATNWQGWPQKGKFEVTAQAQAWAYTGDPGAPLGEERRLLPGTYTVTQEWRASPITNDPDRAGVGSFGGSYYTVDTGELVLVPSRKGSFTPEP